jgi:hypothetical protein
MPIHHTLSHHPRTTAPTTDESGRMATDGSGRTGTGADGGTATGPHTARGAGAVRPDTLPPPPAPPSASPTALYPSPRRATTAAP